MVRLIDVLAVILLVAAAAAFAVGIYAIGEEEDFKALYLLLVGALALRASTEILRPRGGTA